MERAQRNMGTMTLRAAAMLTLALAVMFSASCKKKKKPVQPPATAPTITEPQPQPVPTSPVPPPETTEPAPAPAPAPETTTTTTAPVKKKKPRIAKKPAPKPQPAQPAANKPSGTVGAPTNGEPMSISPNLPAGDANAQKRDTENLLQTAESNLRRINRQLSDGEQSMARQVRNYITQSRLATQDGDLERAHNLAVKAQLLSAELTK